MQWNGGDGAPDARLAAPRWQLVLVRPLVFALALDGISRFAQVAASADALFPRVKLNGARPTMWLRCADTELVVELLDGTLHLQVGLAGGSLRAPHTRVRTAHR